MRADHGDAMLLCLRLLRARVLVPVRSVRAESRCHPLQEENVRHFSTGSRVVAGIKNMSKIKKKKQTCRHVTL